MAVEPILTDAFVAAPAASWQEAVLGAVFVTLPQAVFVVVSASCWQEVSRQEAAPVVVAAVVVTLRYASVAAPAVS